MKLLVVFIRIMCYCADMKYYCPLCERSYGVIQANGAETLDEIEPKAPHNNIDNFRERICCECYAERYWARLR